MTLQYSLCRVNLLIVEIVYLYLGHWRFIKPIIIATNAAPYVVIKISRFVLSYKLDAL